MNSSNWNKIVETSKVGELSQINEYQTLLSKVYGHNIFPFQEKTSIFPVALVKSSIFGNRLISVPFSDYGGPIFSNEHEGYILSKKIISLGKELRVDFVEIRAPNNVAAKILSKNGFEKRTNYCTFVLDLSQSEETLLSHLEKRVRNDVNKAKRQDLTIKEAKSIEDVKIFYKIYLANMKNLGSPPQPLAHFTGLFERFSKNVRITLCYHENKPIAGMLIFLFNERTNYAFGVSIPKYRIFRASDILIWDSISWAKNHGIKTFDFGRTRPNSGVYFYKKGWGGKEVPMEYYYKFLKKKLEKRQEEEFSWVSKLWKIFVPSFVARIIGPWIIKQVG